MLPIIELSFQNKQLTATKVRDPGLKIGPLPSSLLPSSVGSGNTVAAAQSVVFGTPIGLRPAPLMENMIHLPQKVEDCLQERLWTLLFSTTHHA